VSAATDRSALTRTQSPLGEWSSGSVPAVLVLSTQPGQEFRCASCGYGLVTKGTPPACPMCRESAWDHIPSRPLRTLLEH
jgi:hypothetical protein